MTELPHGPSGDLHLELGLTYEPALECGYDDAHRQIIKSILRILIMASMVSGDSSKRLLSRGVEPSQVSERSTTHLRRSAVQG